jgi:hypothetical protein
MYYQLCHSQQIVDLPTKGETNKQSHTSIIGSLLCLLVGVVGFQATLYEVMTSSETEAARIRSNGNLPWLENSSMPSNSLDLMKKLVHPPPSLLHPSKFPG